jgi:hypothetical protein
VFGHNPARVFSFHEGEWKYYENRDEEIVAADVARLKTAL